MDDGVAFADVGEELVAEPRPLARALHNPCSGFDRGLRRHILFSCFLVSCFLFLVSCPLFLAADLLFYLCKICG